MASPSRRRSRVSSPRLPPSVFAFPDPFPKAGSSLFWSRPLGSRLASSYIFWHERFSEGSGHEHLSPLPRTGARLASGPLHLRFGPHGARSRLPAQHQRHARRNSARRRRRTSAQAAGPMTVRTAALTEYSPQRLPPPSRQILNVLPRRAARARAARGRPLERLGPDRVAVAAQAEMVGVAEHHLQELVLAALVEAEPEPEAVGQRHLLLHGLARID